MDYWAKPGLDRGQALLFYPTLDESVSQQHSVRLLDEILRAQDWSAWTQEYNGRIGQPPIPPWVLAGIIVYGLMRRIRSSRCRNRSGPICPATTATLTKLRGRPDEANQPKNETRLPFGLLPSPVTIGS